MKIYPLFTLLLAVLLFAQCKQADAPGEEQKPEPPSIDKHRIDHHSFAKPGEAIAKHLSLDLEIDFEKQLLHGTAKYLIVNFDSDRIIFDINGLQIQKVTIGEAATETTFTIGEQDTIKGQPLEIKIEPDTKTVTIHYSTTSDAAALGWLEPHQTAGKKHPFLFTQGQAILTRSWIPIQDSPGIRITYDARIKLPSDLMAVMSASNPQQKNDEGVYNFEMPQPIPPYLIALAAGDLKFAELGPRTGVYAEPKMLAAAKNEFADVDSMLNVAERLYGPYAWERYDIIVLPPSFPFGGMENPRLTFATPTIIAGDRSLTSLVAHELAHSWSGNLVTNATWNDFWLNEGFTVYFERRIMEAMYGKDYTSMLTVLGHQDLEKTVARLTDSDKADDTALFLKLEGRDPDDGMTDIAYEKGAFFLQLLEEKAGRENFDQFLKTYFESHKFQTITTNEFAEYLKENLTDSLDLEVNIYEWIFGPGIPENIPKVTSARFNAVDDQVKQTTDGKLTNTKDTKEWSTHEWLHFVRHLPRQLDEKKMAQLDRQFNFSGSGNSEIKAAWFELAIYNGYSKKIENKIEAFLVEVGRRKFLEPLYEAFVKTNQLQKAKDIYRKARPNYHSVSRGSIEDLLGIEK